MAKKDIILIERSKGKPYALILRDGFQMGSKFYDLKPLTPAFFLVADPEVTLLRFGNKSDAAALSTRITEAVEARQAGTGTRDFTHRIPRARFKELCPTEIELPIILTPCGEK